MTTHRTRLQVERLEDRRLLAVNIAHDAVAKTLTIDVLDDAPTVVAVTKQGSQIVVTTNDGTGAVEQTFARNQVRHITFNGGNGDDVFTNTTTIKTTLNGEGGNDDLSGGKGKDVISGGEGDDHLSGGKGKDELNGDAGVDHLEGGQSSDRLFGGTEDDVLDGGQGRDFLDGGEGNDTIHNRREDKLAEMIGVDILDLPPKVKGPKPGKGKS